jgi:hypothetical protein
LSSLVISLIVFACVLGGSLAGGYARSRLPKHHLEGDTRDIVKAGLGLLATLAALVLGLIVASAKNSFDTKTEEVQNAAVKLMHIDRSLRQLGSPGDVARRQLAELVKIRVNRVWSMGDSAGAALATINSKPTLEDLQATLRTIPTTDPNQRAAANKALQATEDLAQVRALVIAQSGSAIITPLLVLLVFWFSVISAGLNLFAARNATTLAFNILCALSIAGAIFLVLEMDQAFGGLISVSDAPVRAAVRALER